MTQLLYCVSRSFRKLLPPSAERLFPPPLSPSKKENLGNKEAGLIAEFFTE
jgi:hypothetical protein